MKDKKQESGLSLVEIIIVMTIMAILSYMGLASYQNSFRRSRDSRRQSDLEMIRGALEIYRADNDEYYIPSAAGTGGYTEMLAVLDSDDYINTRPNDPQFPSRGYYYEGTTSTYVLCSFLEGGSTIACPAAGAVNCSASENCNYGVQNP